MTILKGHESVTQEVDTVTGFPEISYFKSALLLPLLKNHSNTGMMGLFEQVNLFRNNSFDEGNY